MPGRNLNEYGEPPYFWILWLLGMGSLFWLFGWGPLRG
jgi:hypothetical protein